MTQENKLIAAVDIGTTKIVAIVGKKNKNGQIEVLGIGKRPSYGVKRGNVVNIEETFNAIHGAVEDAQDASGVTVKDVYVGIAGQHIKSTKSSGYKFIDHPESEILQRDVDEIKGNMEKIPLDVGEEIIHVIPQNFVVDNEIGIRNPVGMFGKRLEGNYHIVVGQTLSAKNIERCIDRAGLNLLRLILEPLASSEAVLTEDEKEAGVALIDIGGGTTDIAVFYDGIVRHTAVIPFGGNVITSDIKEGCSILQRHAESLKVSYGMALSEMAPDDKVVTIPGIIGKEPKEISFKSLACIIQARMEEIIDAVHFELENSGFMRKMSAGIVVTGGGALLKYLPQLIKYKMGLDVRVGFPNRNLASTTNPEINQPMYSTCVGLLMKGALLVDEIKAEVKPVVPKEEPKPVEPVAPPQPQAAKNKYEEEEEEYEPDTRKKKGLFKSFKESFLDIFEEKDTKLY
jgi:cell division protein FtsA